MLDPIQSGCEAVVIKADGRIIAALVHPHLFEQARRMLHLFEEIRAKIAEPYREFPEEEGISEIEATITEVRGKS